MPSEIEAHLPPLAPSAGLDGLDLTPAEARALSPEMFARVFTLASLDDVPVVGPGYRARRPPGARWWLRFRAPPENPGPKDRKEPCWQLVFAWPVHAAEEAGGGVAIAPGTRTLQAKDLDGARMEALIVIARAQGKSIRASTWPIERIERVRCSDLLQVYLDVDLKPPEKKEEKENKKKRNPGARRGRRRRNTAEEQDGHEKETRAERKLRLTYSAALRAFQCAFPTLEVGDCRGRIDLKFEARTGCAPTSRYAYLRTVRMALNAVLERMGVPLSYRVKFDNPDPGPLDKPHWTADEYDRLLAAAAGFRHHPGGAPMMIAGPEGPVQARRRPDNRRAWSRMIPFLAYSVSRNGQIHLTRWVPGTVEPAGRPFARGEERPWLEVLPDCIVFHRDGEQRYDGNKKHGWNLVPREFEPTVRRWYEEDMAAGREWVFHKPDGERYGERLPSWTFRQIVADAGLPEGLGAHELKDLAVQWARAAGIPGAVFAEHADTLESTIERTYGPSRNVDSLEAAAELITQKDWREKEERRAAEAAVFAARRDGARAAAAAAKAQAKAQAKARSKAKARQEARTACERGSTPSRPAEAATEPPAATSCSSAAPVRFVPIAPRHRSGSAAGSGAGDTASPPARRRVASAAN